MPILAIIALSLTAILTFAAFVVFVCKGASVERSNRAWYATLSFVVTAVGFVAPMALIKLRWRWFLLDEYLGSLMLGCGVLLFAGILTWRHYHVPVRWMIPYASVVLAAPVAIALWPILNGDAGSARDPINPWFRHEEVIVARDATERVVGLRKTYSFQSLEGRLPVPPLVSKGDAKLSPAATKHLEAVEDSIANDSGRTELLRVLHEESVTDFTRQEGFGKGRRIGPSLYNRPEVAIPQPSGILSSEWLEVNLDQEPSPGQRDGVDALHLRFSLQFLNPSGFGYMKDRKQVAGFQSHAFSHHWDEKPWKLLRLELVGILMSDEPRVYMSNELPRMEKAREMPTRTVDAFESAGLAKLHAGEELFIRDVPDGIRMMGAIRNATQCQKCHGGARGDLLGAFSYSLQRTP